VRYIASPTTNPGVISSAQRFLTGEIRLSNGLRLEQRRNQQQQQQRQSH
jgi:hypothetical protein